MPDPSKFQQFAERADYNDSREYLCRSSGRLPERMAHNQFQRDSAANEQRSRGRRDERLYDCLVKSRFAPGLAIPIRLQVPFPAAIFQSSKTRHDLEVWNPQSGRSLRELTEIKRPDTDAAMRFDARPLSGIS